MASRLGNRWRKQLRAAQRAVFVRNGVRVRRLPGYIVCAVTTTLAQLVCIRHDWYLTIQGIAGARHPLFTNVAVHDVARWNRVDRKVHL